MKTQSYMVENYAGDVIFNAEFYAITIQRMQEHANEDLDEPPPFKATAKEFPDLVGYGFKVGEAHASLAIQIEERNE